MKICLECKTKPMGEGRLKYCDECAPIVLQRKNKERLAERRKNTENICEECRIKVTRSRYCLSCAQHLRIRHAAKAKEDKPKPKPRKRGPNKYTTKIDEKWLVRGNISTSNRECSITQEI